MTIPGKDRAGERDESLVSFAILHRYSFSLPITGRFEIFDIVDALPNCEILEFFR
jgi:hypothetical protein